MDALSALLSAGVAPARQAGAARPGTTDPTALSGAAPADNAEAARQVESLFAFQLLKAMRKTVPEDGLLSGGKGEDIARTLQDEMLSDAIAGRDAFGLAAQLQKGLDRLQPDPEHGAEKGAEGAPGPNGTR